MNQNKVLIVHEKKQELIALADYLTLEGFRIVKIEEGENLNQNVEEYAPDLIILPVELSRSNGIEVCQKIKTGKKTSDIFVVLMSSRKEEFALIAGLESGADDFLFHPVHKRVLLGRVKALLKRKKWYNVDLNESPFFIDSERYMIVKDGEEFYLPKKEFEILSLLFSKPNKVFSRDEIKNTIWENFEKVRGRTVDVHIRKIREKIGDGLITTVKGVGYRLELVN